MNLNFKKRKSQCKHGTFFFWGSKIDFEAFLFFGHSFIPKTNFKGYMVKIRALEGICNLLCYA